ncbi:hypothetical protein AN639_06760 [Candidatus Epulonipiscium fishelsonii]|uniref:Uncharacterized protein n=1 Tax=Candidatus Epulonipiscium fishelsonii TaxID=77094 RepID=A0ACC8X875_9FIRM|nr:hypothetical protein AN396_12225 [Epulopiscium sp. SCG-B11WGA-EpuloA1]ONI39030.1 hypothetical protein AN639_06760 [Epulopiscium sp. SCG-B05WGA-EpuloA1]
MTFQVLVATMKQDNFSLIKKMNLNSDAIIVNQQDKFKLDKIKYKNHKIAFYTLPEKGLSLSRNTALDRATADICLLADDDIVYESNYKQLIINEFIKNPKADIIIFNLKSTNINRPEFQIKKNIQRIRFYNCLRYGSFRIAFRLNKIKKRNIHFDLLFGAGSKYSHGEEGIFLSECLKKGLRIYGSNKIIGKVNHEVSTWFNGYDEKFFIDRGAMFTVLNTKLSYVYILQFAIRKYNLYCDNYNLIEAIKLMLEGRKIYENY